MSEAEIFVLWENQQLLAPVKVDGDHARNPALGVFAYNMNRGCEQEMILVGFFFLFFALQTVEN